MTVQSCTPPRKSKYIQSCWKFHTGFIESSFVEKDLGVMVDETLNMSWQCVLIAQKAKGLCAAQLLIPQCPKKNAFQLTSTGKGFTEVQWLLTCHSTEHICAAEKRWVAELSKNNYNLPVFIKPFNFQENHVYYFIMVIKYEVAL